MCIRDSVQVVLKRAAVVENQDVAGAGQPLGNHVRAVYAGDGAEVAVLPHKGRSDLPHDVAGLVVRHNDGGLQLLNAHGLRHVVKAVSYTHLGRITDSQGRVVNFENTVIVMTSNAGSDRQGGSVGFGRTATEQGRDKAMNCLLYTSPWSAAATAAAPAARS